MSDDWYVRGARKVQGPFSEKQVRDALAGARIRPETQVRRGLGGPWITAERALPNRAIENSVSRTSKPRRLPIAAALAAGVAFLGGVLWLAFELGRRQAVPVAAAPTAPAVTPNAISAPPLAPAAAKIEPPSPSERKPLLAKRPAAQTAPVQVVDSVQFVGKSAEALQAPKQATSPPPIAKQIQKPPPPAPAVPIAIKLSQAKDADLRALESAANHASTAKDALALYKHFAATRTMTQAQQEKFNANLQVWEERANKNLFRLGDKWVAEADATRAHEEAAQLFRQAYEMVRILNFEEARKTLERASRVDPNSIAADFTLGVLNSLTPPNVRSPKTAEKHFQIVLRRIPGYVPALNNLAIAQIRQEKYAEALRSLREAANLSPTTEEVTHNLGRFVSEAKLGRIRPRKTVLADATKLYAKVVTAKEGVPSQPTSGWLFIPLVSPKGERESLSSVQSPEAQSESFVAQGTGFVIEPHYILTCRHVVDDPTLGRADQIEIFDPADPTHKRRLSATCVDVGTDDDLCLLRCEELKAPAIPLADSVPRRGTEVVLIGFPGGSGFGLGLKTTHGLITALPGDVARIGGPKWFDFSRRLWYDAASSHGASGGAVCDDRGNVVAIHAVGYQPDFDPSNAKYAGGVPAAYAAVFIRNSLHNFAHPPDAGPTLKWADVDAKVSPSIVLIVVGYRKIAIAMGTPKAGARAGLQSRANLYDDRVCSACNGRGRMRCHAPGCQHGFIHGEVVVNNQIVTGNPKAPIFIDNPTTHSTRTKCPVCGGTGFVPCSFCHGGVDPLLR
jgi:S1-C subfamily serine protease